MKKLIFNAVILFGLCFCLPALSAEQNSIGSIIQLQGRAMAKDTQGKRRVLKLKHPVFMGDTIITLANSKAQILFNDETVISQGERSEIVIDEYVYNPDKKEANSVSAKMVEGVFRVVAGKVTELNPDRFRVKTRLATVGIRGCELGFKVQEKKDDILIVWLPKGKSIHIHNDAKGNAGDKDEFITILNSGVIVSIEQGGNLTRRLISDRDSRTFSSAVSPQVTQNAVINMGNGDISSSSGSGLKADKQITETVGMLSGLTKVSNQEEFDQQVQDRLDILAQADTSDIPPPSSSDTPTEAPPPPSTIIPTTAAPLVNGGFPWSSWWWILYEDGSVTHGLDVSTSPLDAADLAMIADVGNPISLSGSGSSAALLRQSGLSQQVTGFCNMDVTVGGPAPNWSADVQLTGGSSSLNLGVSGSIGLDATLSGSIDDSILPYALIFNGQPALNSGTIASESVSGSLYGQGITGASFEYHTSHGSTTADGAAGADLGPAM